MPTLDKSNFNIVCATLGGFITLFGLVSYLFKERLFLSEALISLLAGVVFSTHAIGLIQPLEYAGGSAESLDQITHYFTRLVLGVQLVLAGVQLPSKYLWHQRKPLAMLLGPGMTGMWVCSSLVIWALVPDLPYLHALAVAACVTPTDPVLSNSIVKGKFADRNVPRDLQRIIIAESGANDGLGYPFLFLALYLIQYVGDGSSHITPTPGGAGTAIGLWFSETWAYEIFLGVAYGATVGWIAKELLHWAEEHKYVDRESFLVFAITLALFIVGTCGMIGSDDVLACFIAGNVFTIDDWFRLETLDDSLQPTIDMLLNLSIFLWFGAVCPWASFATNAVIPIYRLIPLGILILLLRRLPVVLALQRYVPQLEDRRLAYFAGFFGPIGVSAIFYLFVSLQFLSTVTNPDGTIRSDAAYLQSVMRVVVWFLAICSIVVHGLSVPLGKLGYHLPRTISSAFESRASTISRNSPDNVDPPSFRLGEQLSPTIVRSRTAMRNIVRGDNPDRASRRLRSPLARTHAGDRPEPVRQVFRIGGSIIPSRGPDADRSKPESESGPSSGEDRASAQPNADRDSEEMPSYTCGHAVPSTQAQGKTVTAPLHAPGQSNGDQPLSATSSPIILSGEADLQLSSAEPPASVRLRHPVEAE